MNWQEAIEYHLENLSKCKRSSVQHMMYGVLCHAILLITVADRILPACISIAGRSFHRSLHSLLASKLTISMVHTES